VISETDNIENSQSDFSEKKCRGEFLKLKENLKKKGIWDENDPTIQILEISQKIAELAKKLEIKCGFHMGELRNQMLFEDPSYNDPFAKLKKQISDLESKKINSSVLWTGYVSVFIAPAIALAISLIAPLLRIPIDQGSLSQLISNAVSQTTFISP